MTPRPPPLSRRVLEWAARRLGTPDLAGDAEEIFAEKRRASGRRAARRWYRRQAVRASARAVAGRPRAVAGRERGRPGSGAGPGRTDPAWLAGLALDARLGARMLVRYPALTVVGGVAMAFAIFVGAATFELVHQLIDPTLPLPDGDRIVGLRYWDRAASRRELPGSDDVRGWRDGLTTVRDIGGFRDVTENMSVGALAGAPVEVARISAVGFRVAGTPPLLGRTLVEADEDPAAPAVVVVGYALWQSRFGGDPGVVGRTVRLGDERPTVVGVMPQGFGFPVAHGLWAPLRPSDPGADPGAEEPLRVFGRLAPGVTLDEARAEVASLGPVAVRTPGDSIADVPAGTARLAAQVLPWWKATFPLQVDGLLFRAMFYQPVLFSVLFLLLVAANVALLTFARSAARERELVVRSALGASRRRIVTQLFVESLVLGAFAAAIGLGATEPILSRIYGEVREIAGPFPLPFWVRPHLSVGTAVWTALLTLAAAAVAGVLPALSVTGRGMRSRLHRAGAGAGVPRLGGLWSGVIVGQVAATVVFTGVAWAVVREAARNASVRVHFPAERYLGARVEMDRPDAGGASADDPGPPAGYAALVRELQRSLAADPSVAGVTLVDRLPVKARGTSTVEVDRGGAAPPNRDRRGYAAHSDAVGLDFFEVFRTPVVAGRAFDSRDLAGDARGTVVVNQSFVEEILGGRSAVGRRVRYVPQGPAPEPPPWYEIVGVVGDLVADQVVTQGFDDPPGARLYHPLRPGPGGPYPLYVVAHVPGGPEALAARVYGAAEAVSPALRLASVETLDRAEPEIVLLWRLYAWIVVLVGGIALFLSLAAVYAVMSFTVARRTREIGVRVALGARAPRVVAETFRAPLARVGGGVALGCVLLGAIVLAFTGGRTTPLDAALLLALGVATLGVCALACIAPTLRALRVEPVEALAADT